MFWNERGKCPKVSDAVCFSPRLPISQIGQNEKLLSLISICVAASGEQSQHKKDNIYHNWSEKNIDYLVFSGVGMNEHLNSKFPKKIFLSNIGIDSIMIHCWFSTCTETVSETSKEIFWHLNMYRHVPTFTGLVSKYSCFSLLILSSLLSLPCLIQVKMCIRNDCGVV